VHDVRKTQRRDVIEQRSVRRQELDADAEPRNERGGGDERCPASAGRERFPVNSYLTVLASSASAIPCSSARPSRNFAC
jgi:hypothetical protein